jgi:uncharacterized membrane protein (UPF0127 family)
MTIVTIAGVEWLVTVATTVEDKSTGLGGLDSIPAGTGMLFVYDVAQAITITTEPMLFDLDIVILDGDLLVTGLHRNVPPGQEIDATCVYFLEVNAGEAAGVQLGDPAVIVGYPPTNGVLDIMSPLVIFMMMFMLLRVMSSAVASTTTE